MAYGKLMGQNWDKYGTNWERKNKKSFRKRRSVLRLF